MKKTNRLSPSALNLFLGCPRCFWMDKVKRVGRPRGIFPSLPGGMDKKIKAYFDSFRAKGALPPELKGNDFIGIKLFDNQEQLDRWRNWQTGLFYQDGSNGWVLRGALDDLLVEAQRYIPFDYKTKGSPTKEEDAIKYYQNQLDCYTLMLHENHLPSAGFGFLLYYSPKSVGEMGNVQFELQVIKIATDGERARKTMRNAVSLLNGPMPDSATDCEYCNWLEKAGNELIQ